MKIILLKLKLYSQKEEGATNRKILLLKLGLKSYDKYYWIGFT